MDGISDSVMVAAINQYGMIQIVSSVLVFIFVLILIELFLATVRSKSPKTARAREAFSDLYVIGMVRKFAKEDGIDLNAEMKEVRRFDKLEKVEFKRIDEVVESELNEKVQAEVQKKIAEIEAESNKKA